MCNIACALDNPFYRKWLQVLRTVKSEESLLVHLRQSHYVGGSKRTTVL